MLYRSLKGFNDILPDETEVWQRLERTIDDLMRRYGYGEIRLPVLESTDLFKRGVGEGTDIVGKEMYTFLDRSDPPESLTLRPELTAQAARAYIEHGIAQTQALVKWYYVAPAFRYEQPQAGRFRQFHTFGVELIGSPYPEADAEVITVAADLLDLLGITNYRVRLNSIGTLEERTEYRKVLRDFLETRRGELSEESLRRMDANPLRVLDSKREEDLLATREAPGILDFLGDESREHFRTVQDLLGDNGIATVVDPRLVRGLDYYSRTAFEFQGLDLGAQDALLGGGRYDKLIEDVGGKPTPAIGFGMGLERIVLAMKHAGLVADAASSLDVYVVALDEASRRWAAGLVHDLRREGLSAEHDLLRRSMKAQMRDANRKGARQVVIAGDSEMAAREAQVKNMQESSQRAVSFDNLVSELTRAAKEQRTKSNEQREENQE